MTAVVEEPTVARFTMRFRFDVLDPGTGEVIASVASDRASSTAGNSDMSA